MFSATDIIRARRRCAAAPRAGSAPCGRASRRAWPGSGWPLTTSGAGAAPRAGRPAPRPAPPGRCRTRRRCRRSRRRAPRSVSALSAGVPEVVERRADPRSPAPGSPRSLRLARCRSPWRRLVAHHHLAPSRRGSGPPPGPLPGQAAAAQHRHLVGELHHLAELVRDHQDAELPARAPSRAAGPAPRRPRPASAPTSARPGSRSGCRGRAASGSRASASRPRPACRTGCVGSRRNGMRCHEVADRRCLRRPVDDERVRRAAPAPGSRRRSCCRPA